MSPCSTESTSCTCCTPNSSVFVAPHGKENWTCTVLVAAMAHGTVSANSARCALFGTLVGTAAAWHDVALSVCHPGHIPSATESGLGATEHSQVCEALLELADPSPAKKTRSRASYIQYSSTDRAQIGRYALPKFPNLKENTIRNAYKLKLDSQRKHICPQPVTEIPHKPRGRPPILLELDEK